MYRLAPKRTEKRPEQNANVNLLRHRQPRLHCFVACCVLLFTEIYVDFGQSRLSKLSLGVFINSTQKNQIAQPTSRW